MKIGLLAETKVPSDERVALTPKQCQQWQSLYKEDQIFVQASGARRISDNEYLNAGIEVVSHLSHCDVLLGIKEVSLDRLLPEKTYLFFSHTIKKQPHNRKLLQAVLDARIRLIDYECLTDLSGNRILGFGRFAGLVGAYNGLWAWGRRSNTYHLPRAFACAHLEEMFIHLSGIPEELLPPRILLTGKGRVGSGVIESLLQAGYTEVDSTAYLLQTFGRPVFTVLEFFDYYRSKLGQTVSLTTLNNHPDDFVSALLPYLQKTDMYIAGHFWKQGAPVLVPVDFLRQSPQLIVIADISCDIKGPVASTLRSSSIENPVYGFSPQTGKEVQPWDGITVMAVDNLPCELPRDASEDFGSHLIEKILPSFHNGDPLHLLDRATIAEKGKLTPAFCYLSEYVAGE